MPFARLTILSPREGNAASELGTKISGLVAEVLKKKHHLTSVLVDHVDRGSWSVGGQPQTAAAQLEVYVTAGTNTEQEKRDFVRRAAELLKQSVAGLDPATYVVVHELPGSDWGYDGATQADRAVVVTGRSPA
jgi:4-oxalocrotonate tautomerase